MIVMLDPWELDWVRHVAEQRNVANEGKRDAAHYDPARMQDNLVASVAACASELAVAKAVNRYWDGSYWSAGEHSRYADRPDVGTNIEVRRVRKRGNPLPVRKRDVDRGRVMFLAYPVPDDFREVHVLGYVKAADGWAVGRPADYDAAGNTRLVEQRHLISADGVGR